MQHSEEERQMSAQLLNMNFIKKLQASRVAVVGLGVSGVSTLGFLRRHHIHPEVFDSRAQPPLMAETQNLLQGINYQFGPFSLGMFNDFDFVIVSPGISLTEPALAHALSVNDNVFCDVELFARINNKPVVAVTGSNGKSTVVAWLEDWLNRIGKKAVACGNYGIPVLDVIDGDYDYFVIELSSFQLETTSSLNTVVSTVLNVTEDHMDRYDSLTDYSRAKNKIYNHAQHCLYNHDDFETKPLLSHSQVECFGLVKTSFDSCAWSFDSSTQALKHRGQTLCYFSDFKIQGEHNALNALVVMALAHSLAITLDDSSLTALQDFGGLPHRCCSIASINDIDFIDDSKATNVASTQAALMGLGCEKKKHIVLIAGGDAKGADLTALATNINDYVKAVVALGKDKTDFSQAVKDEPLLLVETMQQAVSTAYEQAQAGDIILLSPACASIDMFRNYQHRAMAFAEAISDLNNDADLAQGVG